MKMYKVVPKSQEGSSWPTSHWIPICESCIRGEHKSYGTNHLPPHPEKLDPASSSFEYKRQKLIDEGRGYTCKNVGHINGERVQCNCTATWPELLEAIKKYKKVESSETPKTWREIEAEYDEKYGINHHRLRLECVRCGGTMTCRCSTPKTLEKGICWYCTGELERMKPLIFN